MIDPVSGIASSLDSQCFSWRANSYTLHKARFLYKLLEKWLDIGVLLRQMRWQLPVVWQNIHVTSAMKIIHKFDVIFVLRQEVFEIDNFWLRKWHFTPVTFIVALSLCPQAWSKFKAIISVEVYAKILAFFYLGNLVHILPVGRMSIIAVFVIFVHEAFYIG